MSSVSDSNFNFIHFGCWNYLTCDYKSIDNLYGSDTKSDTKSITSNQQVITNPITPITQVMTEINKYVIANKENKNKVKFITIACDNYYKKKQNPKDQQYSEEDMKSGFNCLPKDINKYLLVGNHDLQLYYKESKKAKCNILDYHKELASKENSKFIIDTIYEPFIEPTLPSNDKNIASASAASDTVVVPVAKPVVTPVVTPIMHINEGSTYIIMLDTTMYETEEYVECYKQLYKLDDSDSDSDEKLNVNQKVIEIQNKKIAKCVELINKNERINKIIIIGHHPIACIKPKPIFNNDSKFITENEFNNKLADTILNEIYSKITITKKKINYYYLCADLHQYQAGSITITNQTNTMTLDQYICGTGGTELDNYTKTVYGKSQIPTPQSNTITIDDTTIIYSMKSNISSYGFLVCSVTDNDFYTEFFECCISNLESFTSKLKQKSNKKKEKKEKKEKTEKTETTVKTETAGGYILNHNIKTKTNHKKTNHKKTNHKKTNYKKTNHKKTNHKKTNYKKTNHKKTKKTKKHKNKL